MNTTSLIDKLRSLIANFIVRFTSLFFPRDKDHRHLEPFIPQKQIVARKIHKLVRWIMPKAEYEEMLKVAMDAATKQNDEAIAKLEAQATANPPGAVEIINTHICDEILPYVKDDPEFMSQRISKNVFRMSPPLEHPLYVEQQGCSS